MFLFIIEIHKLAGYFLNDKILEAAFLERYAGIYVMDVRLHLGYRNFTR